jgi:hypothetical protein
MAAATTDKGWCTEVEQKENKDLEVYGEELVMPSKSWMCELKVNKQHYIKRRHSHSPYTEMETYDGCNARNRSIDIDASGTWEERCPDPVLVYQSWEIEFREGISKIRIFQTAFPRWIDVALVRVSPSSRWLCKISKENADLHAVTGHPSFSSPIDRDAVVSIDIIFERIFMLTSESSSIGRKRYNWTFDETNDLTGQIRRACT